MTIDLEEKVSMFTRMKRFFKRHAGLAALAIGMNIFAYGCTPEGCEYDSQCSTGRICVDSECVANPNYHPNNSYEEIQDNYYDSQPDISNPCENNVYFLDADKDGFGSKTTWICEPADGFVSNDADCDDNDANIGGPITCTYDGTGCGTFNLCANTCPQTPTENPCNNKDDNCNGQVDENRSIEYQKACDNGKVHWQDECGNLGAIIETCIGTTNCSKTCVGTEVHWMNECGGIEAKIETCVGNNECKTTCYKENVHLINECGGIETKIETCAENEKCIDGACECQPDCYNKKCSDDGCGGSCGSCEDGFECKVNENSYGQISSYCECIPDCGEELCCAVDGKECASLTYFDFYKCVVPGTSICYNKDGQAAGTCPPGKVCSLDWTCNPGNLGLNCCPPEMPYVTMINPQVGATTELCCDQCYVPGYFKTLQEAYQHCDKTLYFP